MNSLRNKVQLIGHLGTDPELKTLKDKRKRVTFSMATNEVYKNAAGEKVTETQWHNITIWGKTAEIAGKYLAKGKEVALTGKLTHRIYEDKKGVKKFFSEVVVSDFVMLGKKGD
ncbi:MAG: single-stranded DNA-binding protein [Candidatus Cyclobacteriaceae bacterium M3_2C_046]